MNKTLLFTVLNLFKSEVHLGTHKDLFNSQNLNYFIGSRKDIQIINLEYTIILLRQVFLFLKKFLTKDKRILFVFNGNSELNFILKKLIKKYNHFYIVSPWVGGTLTNLKEVRKFLSKKSDSVTKHDQKLSFFFEGIKKMKTLPDILVIMSPHKNKEVINEAFLLNIPIIGFLNGNSKLEKLTYFVPGNFTSFKSIILFCVLFNQLFIEINKHKK